MNLRHHAMSCVLVRPSHSSFSKRLAIASVLSNMLQLFAFDLTQVFFFFCSFEGECWTSSDLDSFNKNGPKQNKNGCKSFDHKECKDTDLYCVGAADHSYVYKLI